MARPPQPVAALTYLHAHAVDLLFWNINLPGPALLKSLNPAPAVVFMTAYSEFSVESFELEAVD